VAVHDLGGPIAMHWALGRPERITGIALLNTLLYPELIASSLEFLTRLSTPGSREELTSPEGLTTLFRSGLAHPERASAELLAAVTRPFPDDDSRLALAYAGTQLSRRGLVEIAKGLPGLRVPVRIVYGAQDRLLTDIEETIARLRADLPQAVVTALAQAGHFLQEDAPDEVGRLLAEFFAGLSTEDNLQRT
jgi:haloalkane dehalogenase